MKLIASVPAVDHIIAGTCVDKVVPRQAKQGVVRVVAVQMVILRRGRPHDAGLDRGRAPHGSVVEPDLIDHVARSGAAAEIVGDRHLIARADNRSNEGVVVTAKNDVGGQHTRLQLQRVNVPQRRFVVDLIATRSATEQEGIAPDATVERVVTPGSVQGVIATVAGQDVIAKASSRHVVPRRAREVDGRHRSRTAGQDRRAIPNGAIREADEFRVCTVEKSVNDQLVSGAVDR